MIIDFHTHIGSVVNKNENDLLQSMDNAKIDKSIIFAGDVCGLTNEELIKVLDKNGDRFFGVVAVYPHDLKYMKNNFDLSGQSVNEINKYYQFLNHPKVIGVKFYTGYHHYYANDNRVYKIMEILKNKIAIFHCGDTYSAAKNAKLKYTQPLTIDDMANDFPDTKIVIAHMGYPWYMDTAAVMYKNSNVYTDISGFVYGNFDDKKQKSFHKMIDEVDTYLESTEKILFGTDWPISDQKSYIDNIDYKKFNNNTVNLINEILEKR